MSLGANLLSIFVPSYFLTVTKGVSFSDFICTFAMSFIEFSCFFCNTNISEFFDMTKS